MPDNEPLELHIDDLAYGGNGVARDEGFVIFVSGGLPGDVVRARVVKRKRGYAEAEVVEVLRSSPDRIPATCLHGGEPCPGAPWQSLPYERQLEHKQRQVREALERIGKLEGFALEPIEPAVGEWRYRNKLEYSFGERDEELVLGFHRRGRWNEVVDVEDCHLASVANNAARNAVRDWARREGLAAYDRRARSGLLRNLVVREGRRTGQLQSRLVTAAGELPKPPVDLHTVIEGSGSGTEGPTGAIGEEYLEEEICGLRLRISGLAFFQTNTEMAERLYGIAADFAGLGGRERVFDLFCGTGTIALALAGRAGEVWGLELNEAAIADAEANAALNGIANVHFLAGNARTSIRPLVERAGKPDVVVIDPPRAGLSAKIVRRVLECEAKRVVYVSCNPTTLAPNAAQMVEAGYRLIRVKPVDMFPQTPHIECVALLERVE
jgi:23S rRNA (uracil1939-C5)-methyltransferase